MTATATPATLRIGEVAEQTGTTPRTIRYYEEIGLLPRAGGRERGAHRVYTEAEVDRLREIVRLRDLLGLSLDELREVMAAEDERAQLRTELRSGSADPGREREILREAAVLIDRQLELVRRRRDQIAELEADLVDRRARVAERAKRSASRPGR